MKDSATDQPRRRSKRDLQAAAALLPVWESATPLTAGLLESGTVLSVPLEAKIQPPELRPEWVERPDLVRQLSDVTARLILISAPAGFGKTVLVSQWRAGAAGSRFAWVTLDSGDNNPSRLWWKVISAVRRACPEFDADPPRVLIPRQGRTLLPVLIARLAALPAPVVLVLDDYQVINHHGCHMQVEFLLQDLPRPIQIVLATRATPSLQLARLRAAGEVADIGTRELRFSRAEAAALVSTVAGVGLGGADLTALDTRTEGWPAGVYLAALSLRGHPSPQTFIDQFTGSNRFIADFLAEEVLNRQPPDIRQFLLRTSILDRFSAPLCDAVTGSADAARLIDRLERENLFLVPADEHRVWYRYHYLFAQMLRGQLSRTEPGLLAELHERASAWHRAAHLPLAQPLTERERAVLRLLFRSLSVSEIARELYLSGNTVKTHRRAIYRKLGVSTRQEAIQRAQESGILP
jgi:ATP/maltotriose-dependent transcriptional regulator MalT